MYTLLDQIRDHVVLGAFIIALGSYFWWTTRSQNARIEQLREKYTLGTQPRRKVAKYLPPLPLPQLPQSSTQVQQPEQKKPFTGLVTAPSFSAYDRPPELQVSIRPVRLGKTHDQKEQYLPILVRHLSLPYEGPRQDFYNLPRRNIPFEPARRVDLGTHNAIPTYEAADSLASHPDFGKEQRWQQREPTFVEAMHGEQPVSRKMHMSSNDERQHTESQKNRANNITKRTRTNHIPAVVLPLEEDEVLNATPSKRPAEEQANRRKTSKVRVTNRIFFQSSEDERDFTEDDADIDIDNLPETSHMSNEGVYKRFEERILRPAPVRREHTKDLLFQDDEGSIDESLPQRPTNRHSSRSTKRPRKSGRIERDIERTEQISKKRKASPQSTAARQPKAIRMPADSLWRPDGTIAEEEDEKKENVDGQGIPMIKELKVTFATPNINGKRPREPLRPDSFVEPQQTPRTSQGDFDSSNVTPRQTPSFKYMHDIVKGTGPSGNNRTAPEKKDVATSYDPPTTSNAAGRIRINPTPTRPTTLRASFLPDPLSSPPPPPPRPLANYTFGTPLKKKPDLRNMTEDEVDERARRLLRGDTDIIQPAQGPISETTKNPTAETPAQESNSTTLDNTRNTNRNAETPISFGSISGSTTLIPSVTSVEITKPIADINVQGILQTQDTKANIFSVPSSAASASGFSFPSTASDVSKPVANTPAISSGFFSVSQSQEQKTISPFSFLSTSTISSSGTTAPSIMSRLGGKNDNASLAIGTSNLPSYIPTTGGFGGNLGFGILTSTTDQPSVIPAPVTSSAGVSTGFTFTSLNSSAPITTGEQTISSSVVPSSAVSTAFAIPAPSAVNIPSFGLTNAPFTHIASTSTSSNATTAPVAFGFNTQTVTPQTSVPQILTPQISIPSISAPQMATSQIAAPQTLAPQTSAPQTSALQTSALQTSALQMSAPQASAPQTSIPAFSASAPFSFAFGTQTSTATTASSAPAPFSFSTASPASTNFTGTFNIPASTSPFTSVTQSTTSATTSIFSAPSTSATSFGSMTNPVSNAPSPFGATTSAAPTPFNATAPINFAFGTSTSTAMPSTGFNSGTGPLFGNTSSTSSSTPTFGAFGSTTSPMDTGSGFGNTTSTSSSFFGSAANMAASGPPPTFTFGNQTTSTPSSFNNPITQSGFGAPGQSTSMFNAPPATSGPTTSFSNFGAPSSTTTGFGSAPTTGNFGGFNSQASTFATGFGAQPPPAGTGFGAQPPPAGTGFGVQPPPVGTGFGAQPPPAGTGFGAQPPSTGTAFGAPPQVAGTGFAGPPTGFNTAPPSASFGFGASTQPSVFSAGQPQTSMFGASQQSGFGAQAAGGFNLGQTQQQPGQGPFVFGANQMGGPGVQFNMGTTGPEDRKFANPKSRVNKGRQRR